jgi:hypothetical protein
LGEGAPDREDGVALLWRARFLWVFSRSCHGDSAVHFLWVPQRSSPAVGGVCGVGLLGVLGRWGWGRLVERGGGVAPSPRGRGLLRGAGVHARRQLPM